MPDEQDEIEQPAPQPAVPPVDLTAADLGTLVDMGVVDAPPEPAPAPPPPPIDEPE